MVFLVLKQRKEIAGMLLGRVCSVDFKKFPREGFGETYHSSCSKPWFYDTAYKVLKCQSAIAVVGVRGVCFVVEPVKGGEQNSTEQDRDNKTEHERCDDDNSKHNCKLCGANVQRTCKCHECSAKIDCTCHCTL